MAGVQMGQVDESLNLQRATHSTHRHSSCNAFQCSVTRLLQQQAGTLLSAGSDLKNVPVQRNILALWLWTPGLRVPGFAHHLVQG